MISIEEIQNKIAIKQGWKSYLDFIHYLMMRPNIFQVEKMWVDIAEEYKNQGINHVLDEAAKKAKAKYEYRTDDWGMNRTLHAYVDTDSILSLKIKDLDDVAKNGGWVNVDERLPDEGGRYWCYIEDINDLGKSFYQWNCSYNENDKVFNGHPGGRITHWRPLAPKPIK